MGPPRRSIIGRTFNRGIGNGGMMPPSVPPKSTSRNDDWGGGDDNSQTDTPVVSANHVGNETSTMNIRGGSTKQRSKNNSSNNDRALKGVTLASTASYWSSAFGKAGDAVTKPFKAVGKTVSSTFQSKQQKREQELMAKLETTKVQSVVMVPNTTVVPKEVVQLAARRSGLIGNPLRTDRVQDFAAMLKRWYQMRGYVLHSVTGATLNADSATAEIKVQEPSVSTVPVDIVFCKEMVVDPETGNILTFRQYKERQSQRKKIGHKSITRADTNMTIVQTSGKTRPSRIARALGLQPGAPFQWDNQRWKSVAESGIFGRIFQAEPRRLQDGSVQLQITATEAPPRHLEYGVTKSLYTGSWEGEVDFQHDNLLGGGESLAVLVRRGTKDPEPSVTLRFRDEKFGMPGGYDVEAFSDYIGDNSNDDRAKDKEKGKDAESDQGDTATVSNDPNKLFDRRGVKFTYRNPIDTGRIRHSSASTSLERTATKSGIREAIGSGSLSIGPFRRELPFEARSSVDGRISTGLRIPDVSAPPQTASDDLRGGSSYRGVTLLPYTSFRLTTTQVLPLLSSSYGNQAEKQPTLALRHSVSGSTRNLPLHEQNAMGNSCMIRGGYTKGSISTFVAGSTELRVPLNFQGTKNAALQNIQKDASVVLFGDWVSARKSNGSPFAVEKSIGLGIRKVTQGLPLKVDFSYAGNGKVKSSFGLGRDFDV